MLNEHNFKSGISIRVGLSTEHFYAVQYALENMVRYENTTQDTHNHFRELLSEVVEIGLKEFSKQAVVSSGRKPPWHTTPRLPHQKENQQESGGLTDENNSD